MAGFLNAIKGEIANRVIAFLMDKSSELTTPTTEGARLHDLQQLLLRVRVIIEEAEGRHITNPLISYQLNMLRKEMYRGYFTLDSLRSQCQEELKAKAHDVSNSFTLSKFNPAKRLFFSIGNAQMEKEIRQVLNNLNDIMVDVGEFVKLLNNYPPLYRQPYSMHLCIGKCMFGRQMEMDRVIDFLTEIECPIMENIGVLPIVGPLYVGKSTLVAHVCNDARVRNHFSEILVLSGDEINDESRTRCKDGGLIIGKDNTFSENGRLLAIIEFSRDVDDVAWNGLYSSACCCLGRGSKIIITSQSNKIKNFGTTSAVVLNFLPREAYWYFFKILTFGSVDSSDHPKIESIAMEMAGEMNGSFIGAYINSDFLRNNFSVEDWFTHLAKFKACIQRNVSLFGENPYALAHKNKPSAFWVNNKDFVIYNRACFSEDNVPAITIFDILSESANKLIGELEVLLWKSHILPYKSYVVSCMIEESQ